MVKNSQFKVGDKVRISAVYRKAHIARWERADMRVVRFDIDNHGEIIACVRSEDFDYYLDSTNEGDDYHCINERLLELVKKKKLKPMTFAEFV